MPIDENQLNSVFGAGAPVRTHRIGHHKRPGDFGPKQLAWLDARIHGFKAMREQAAAARAHTEQQRAALEGAR